MSMMYLKGNYTWRNLKQEGGSYSCVLLDGLSLYHMVLPWFTHANFDFKMNCKFWHAVLVL